MLTAGVKGANGLDAAINASILPEQKKRVRTRFASRLSLVGEILLNPNHLSPIPAGFLVGEWFLFPRHS